MRHSSGRRNARLDRVEGLSQFADPGESSGGADDSQDKAVAGVDGRRGADRARHSSSGPVWQVVGVLAEVLVTLGLVCGLYVIWQLWWTGVEAERVQADMRQSVSWSDPASDPSVTVAKPQEGEPPIQSDKPKDDDLLAEIYVPRFGSQWVRNIVEGVSAEQLSKHGLGRYPDSQMPGEVGNFAVAGHRNGYGYPLGDVDKLQEGDPIVVRTKDHWYVYKYTSHLIVLPEDTYVIAPNPEDPTATPTKRMITLTTCEPKYSTPTHRWIVHGELQYWANVADGIPEELSTKDASGAVKFVSNEQVSALARLRSLLPVIVVALIAYAVIFLSSAIVWRWPARRAIRLGERRKPDLSIYGMLTRLQPGPIALRLLLVGLLLFAGCAALFQWVFPWAASTVPFLREMSSYVTV